MCEPTTATLVYMTIASAVVSAAGTAVAANAQQKSANSQADAMRKQEQQQQNALALQQQQAGSQAAEAMNERSKQAMIEAATFDAISGEYGGGVSSTREAAALAFNRDHDLATIKANRDMNLSQLGQESQGIAARTNAGLASISRPSRLGVGLTIAGQAAGAYAGMQRPQTGKVDLSEPGRAARPNRAGA